MINAKEYTSVVEQSNAQQEEIERLRAQLDTISAKVPAEYAQYSKDWRESDTAGRIDWLIAMYESVKEDRDALCAELDAFRNNYTLALGAIDALRDEFREGAEAAARLIDQKAELYANRFGHDNTGGISFGQGPHAKSRMDHYTGLLELADELRATLAATPKLEDV